MALRPVVVCLCACLSPLQLLARQQPLQVYLDCDFCFENFIREEVDLVEYVRDPAEADVHLIVTSTEIGSGGRERAVALIGLGRFKGMDFKLRALSESGDSEDTERQRLATAIKIGLLNHLSSEGVTGGLDVDVEQAGRTGQGGVIDRWHHWVVSLQGSVSTSGEESSRTLDLNGDVGADHITDAWKITMGFEIEHRREDFDLDDDDPLRAIRRQRDFDILSVGPYGARYVEETLFFTTSDRLVRQEASIAIDQREPWGSLEGELEYSSLLPEPSRYRLQLEWPWALGDGYGPSSTTDGSSSQPGGLFQPAVQLQDKRPTGTMDHRPWTIDHGPWTTPGTPHASRWAEVCVCSGFWDG
jgi:hypothetical protein